MFSETSEAVHQTFLPPPPPNLTPAASPQAVDKGHVYKYILIFMFCIIAFLIYRDVKSQCEDGNDFLWNVIPMPQPLKRMMTAQEGTTSRHQLPPPAMPSTAAMVTSKQKRDAKPSRQHDDILRATEANVTDRYFTPL